MKQNNKKLSFKSKNGLHQLAFVMPMQIDKHDNKFICDDSVPTTTKRTIKIGLRDKKSSLNIHKKYLDELITSCLEVA